MILLMADIRCSLTSWGTGREYIPLLTTGWREHPNGGSLEFQLSAPDFFYFFSLECTVWSHDPWDGIYLPTCLADLYGKISTMNGILEGIWISYDLQTQIFTSHLSSRFQLAFTTCNMLLVKSFDQDLVLDKQKRQTSPTCKHPLTGQYLPNIKSHNLKVSRLQNPDMKHEPWNSDWYAKMGYTYNG